MIKQRPILHVLLSVLYEELSLINIRKYKMKIPIIQNRIIPRIIFIINVDIYVNVFPRSLVLFKLLFMFFNIIHR